MMDNEKSYGAPASSVCEPGYISGLREQIKANAGLLFTSAAHGFTPQSTYDIAIMTTNTTAGSMSFGTSPKYQAVLTYLRPISQRMASIAAKGQPSESVVASLESLLFVLASALEKYQGNSVKDQPLAPVEIAGGLVDEEAVLGKSWSLFSGKSKR